ncbi:uncharacterized protein PV07_04019 [Cladophialophora immunda]|uniref:Uncharacterized protein n=1 Tax=Cladophialophora immunda TaxID=569365 RepID=A0A0D2D9V7_9EURO|nr:uncharacterized protein PV07_04019 [Cladophialophora immunda]KIW32474.1 hypothetical protein PV07_04019 [Cladophialophora immunda]
MAEAIAALSLASNILQVIDFGSKFVSTAWKIYNATHRNLESLDEIASLNLLNHSLSAVLQDIRTQSCGTDLAGESNRGILNLSKECATLVENLVTSLNEIARGDPHRKRAAVVAAFKLMWKREEMNVLQARLNDFRSQLTLSLLVSMRYYASQSLVQQNAILKGLEKAQESTPVGTSGGINSRINTSDPFGTSVLNYVTFKLNQKEQEQARLDLKTEIIHAIHNASLGHSQIRSSAVGTTIPEEAGKRSLSMLLASLRYSGMNDREERISEAHETTFQWLLKDSDTNKWVSFKDWLESDDKLYWITGKAGSGKSTLIKYICYPVRSTQEPNPVPRCRQFLETWSSDKHLVIASFYFWNSGIQTQMTQRGLLMSLLHQILNQCPQLAPSACPDRWESLSLFGEDLLDWDDQELRDRLYWVTKNINQVNSTVALFVDGLDEFQGKPEELISLFKDIVDYSNIKLCVASRPWVEFQDAFQHSPSLMLEYLTYDDIKSFVTSKFHGEPMFAQLQRREEEFADQLIESIVVKAAGVFLWVTLVVSSLIAGMNAGDRVSDFMRRLDQLPPDLSKLYEKMLLSLDHFYLDHASQLFSLVRTSSMPMNVVLASFVDEDDPSFALRQPCRPLSEDETVLRIDTISRRINSRSKGLLEVKGPPSTPGRFKISQNPWNYSRYTVQYLHRTVKDYIESDEAQMFLQPAARSPFDPHLRLLAGHIAYIKRLDPDKISAQDLWRDYLQESLKLASSVSPGSIPQMVLLLDEMDKIGRDILRAMAARRRKYGSTAISKSILWAYHEASFESLDRGRLGDFKHTFLSLTVILGVVEYVRVKAEAGCLIRRPHFDTTTTEISYCGEWPLLMDAVMYGASSMYYLARGPRKTDTGPNHKMIQCLLEKSADPNYLVSAIAGEETSPLIESVSQLMLSVSQVTFPSKRSEKEHFWIESTRLLARAGRLDKDTIDHALVMFLEETGLRWLPFRFQTFIQKAHAKKLLRKSLQTLVEGGNPDISNAIAKIERLTEDSEFMRRPRHIARDI